MRQRIELQAKKKDDSPDEGIDGEEISEGEDGPENSQDKYKQLTSKDGPIAQILHSFTANMKMQQEAFKKDREMMFQQMKADREADRKSRQREFDLLRADMSRKQPPPPPGRGYFEKSTVEVDRLRFDAQRLNSEAAYRAWVEAVGKGVLVELEQYIRSCNSVPPEIFNCPK